MCPVLAKQKKRLEKINEALELYYEDEQKPSFMKIEKPELIDSCLSYA